MAKRRLEPAGLRQGVRPDSNDYFGHEVALSADGSVVAVGAPSEDSGATGLDGPQTDNLGWESGAVYAYRRRR